MLRSAQYAEEDTQKRILGLNIIYNMNRHLNSYMHVSHVTMQNIYRDIGVDI